MGEDGSVGPPLLALGEEEIDLLEKVQQIIRADPGKAESLFEKFQQILKEEGKEVHCNMLRDWDEDQIRLSPPPSPDSGSVKTLRKRGARLTREAEKEKEVSKGKRDHQNLKFRKVERKQTGVENFNKPRKLGKKKKQKEKKKKRKTKKALQKKKRKTTKKMKNILKMKKIKQQRNKKQGNKKTK